MASSRDFREFEIKKNDVSAAYVMGPVKVHASLENSANFAWGGLVYKPIPSLEVGAFGEYKSGDNNAAKGGAALKYLMDCCTAVKVKADSDLMIGIGFETKIRQPVTITMSAEIDANRINGKKMDFFTEK